MRHVISCVVDQGPKFYAQLVLWLKSLGAVGAHRDFDIVVHSIGPPPASVKELLAAAQVRWIEVSPFGPGPAVYCNKLRQLDTLQPSVGQYAILSDVDLAFAHSPLELTRGERLRAKLVDMPSPPARYVRRLLAEAGFTHERLDRPTDHVPEALTHKFNLNGGFYVIPSDVFTALRHRWPKWARHCLSSTAINTRRKKHSDQLGLMLALLEAGCEVDHLSPRYNYPLHQAASDRHLSAIEPAILHYHDLFTPSGTLLETGHAKADRVVRQINQRIRAMPILPGEPEIWADYAALQSAA